ncbi:sigma-54-dependent Fis family transcriptional regulator [Pararobbsia silviterrae]|uniref:Sigma-54-dependent Fis family transcriptional regulator n=1 Tax=Pararobbsia silviterrae TaxID=1792498 RepID=A0A494Y2M9_9BURK|nr:sigma-54-dependent Fis family transcriptional regulator [Pararobbsia silviterrae]RKP55713.1 sigma-54-dependent Fis family transcriptional regulator [Pararobbsia silviterrae]
MASHPPIVRDARTHAHPDARLADMIQKSRDRSVEFGLSESMTPDYSLVGAPELALRIDQNRVLCTHALPVMETLYGQIANTHSMVVLTDVDGLILHSLGDDDFLRRAEKVALRAGANWSERQQGTNAIGTTLAEAQPTTVYGKQHFLRANHFLACSSVPILDPYGALLGVLDVTGDCRSHHRHTMALAKMSAQMIENHLFASTFTQALRIHFHSRPEFIGTLMEGIAAFRADGSFLSANRSAQFQLGLPLASLRAHTLSSLFTTSSGELIDRICSAGAANSGIELMLHSGVRVRAHVEFRRAGSVALGVAMPERVRDAVVPERVPTMPAPRASQVSLLDTGDAAVSAVLGRVRKVIGKPIPILIGGETGTGKDRLAHAIHLDSPRADGPWIGVNCGAIPDTLIEAELFGYAEGAFTGAARGGRLGKIAEAHRGTLFLDEIGDMPYALQTRLLGVLETHVVVPLGSNKARPVDFTLICATHRNLREMVARGTFREDLYYRINGLFVSLPALRERTDIEAIIEALLRTERVVDRPLSIDAKALALFRAHPWPGNLRQLVNVLRAACAMLDTHESTIGIEHLPADFLDAPLVKQDAVRWRDVVPRASSAPALANGVAPVRLSDVTSSTVAAALAACAGNVSAAARMLGVSRGTLYRSMKREREI